MSYAMRVFLSLPKNELSYRDIEATLSSRGLLVSTNYDSYSEDSRLERIRNSDAYVFFASGTDRNSIKREIEFGYAIGLGLPVAYVGRTLSILHRFGDVFDDADDFLSWWYSGDYLSFLATRSELFEGTQAIA